MGSVREFDLVTEVSSPGLYFFAANLKQRSYEDALPDGGGLSTDNIFGARPRWESTIPAFLRERFSTLASVRYEYDHGVYLRVYSPWLGQSGTINLRPEYYQFLSLTRAENDFDSPILSISGSPRLTRTSPNGSNVYLARAPDDPDGKFFLELTGSKGKKLDSRGEYWRGRFELKGNNLGRVINAAVGHLNDQIRSSSIPVWRVTEPQS